MSIQATNARVHSKNGVNYVMVTAQQEDTQAKALGLEGVMTSVAGFMEMSDLQAAVTAVDKLNAGLIAKLRLVPNADSTKPHSVEFV